MRTLLVLTLTMVLGVVTGFTDAIVASEAAAPKRPPGGYRGLHLINYRSDADLEKLGKELAELARMGINLLILEVNYAYRYQSHPELRAGKDPITKAGARKLVGICREHGIRLIPQFQCVGHQSSQERTSPLLTQYPELDLTPGAFPNNKGIFSREWDPLNPKVNRIILALFDELIEAFDADAMHVGMDEVFLIGSEKSPSTKGKDPAKVFAKAVNDYHHHLVKKRGLEMLMWGDRLIDGKKYDYGRLESSVNGTAAAVEMIPKDIIICDWHYGLRDNYPSIPMFLEKGFRVLSAGWRDVKATKALIQHGQSQNDPNMLGHLFTTWSGRGQWTEYPPMVEGLKLLTGDD